MGLFDSSGADGGGFGLSLEEIMKMLNPISSAQAAEPAMSVGGLTKDSLLNSQRAMNPTTATGVNPAFSNPPLPPGVDPIAQKPGWDMVLPPSPTTLAGSPPLPPEPSVVLPPPIPNPLQTVTPSATEAWRSANPLPAAPVLAKPTPTPVPDSVVAATGAPGVSAAEPQTTTDDGLGAALVGNKDQPTDVSAAKKRPSLADALRGVTMPKGPELQKIGTPAAPRPSTQIKSGELLALLQALNAGGGGGAIRPLGK